MFKKKDVKKPKDISENNNSSGDSNELSLDELDNVAGGIHRRCQKGPHNDYLCGFTHVMDGERRY